MATLTRRTWADIKTEVISSVGGVDYSGFSTRVEYAIDSAYREICGRIHHPELEAVSSLTVATDATTISLPTSPAPFIPMGLYRPSTPTLGNMLQTRSFAQLTQIFTTTAAVPQFYCRFGDKFVLNCPVAASVAGTWTLRSYNFPTPPDFSSGSPATAWLWDEFIIQGAIAIMMGRVWRPDLSMFSSQTLEAWIASQVQPELAPRPISELPDIPTASRPLGGSQG